MHTTGIHQQSYLMNVLLQEGSVSLLKISPSESSLAVCNGGGHVSLWELNLPHQGISRVSQPHLSVGVSSFHWWIMLTVHHSSNFLCVLQRVHVSSLLKDAAVIDMVWDNKATRLFFGDDQGRLAVSYMPKVSPGLTICLVFVFSSPTLIINALTFLCSCRRSLKNQMK